MTNLVQSLFRIDPTEGLVQYVKAVKPYHTKVLDVLVEYIYSERVSATVKDRWRWEMHLTRPKVDVEVMCGYGIVWDPSKNPSTDISANILSAQTTVSMPINVRLTTDPKSVSTSQSGATLVSGTRVTLSTTGTLPASIPQVAIGHVYEIQGHNSDFSLIDPITNTAISFLTNGSGTAFINLVDVKVNTFLVAPNYGLSYGAVVTNYKSNQLTFVDTFKVASVNIPSKYWIATTDLRPTYAISVVLLDDVTVGSQAGNCSFVIDGNHEDHFPPGSTFTITGSNLNNGTFTVSSSAHRSFTRFDGKRTIIPVNETASTTATLQGNIS